VIAPIAAAVGVFLTALVMHLLVILVVGSGHSGFGATFRIVSYSSVTSLVSWIPFVGWLFSLYRLYLGVGVGARPGRGPFVRRARWPIVCRTGRKQLIVVQRI
jgi:hypothetical protein